MKEQKKKILAISRHFPSFFIELDPQDDFFYGRL
jgi:hypothetical protein